MTRTAWAPDGVDIDHPSAARMYDYYLGGWHNLDVDRQLADQAIAAVPDLPKIARSNRVFLRRVVEHCLAAGIRQFLDIGSGIPTEGSAHEIALGVDPRARVVYVDIDPVAVGHAKALLGDSASAAVIREDARHPEAILAHPETTRILDLSQPVAVLLISVLHFLPDTDHPADLVHRLLDPLPPGSALALAHATEEGAGQVLRSVLQLYQRTPMPLVPRPQAEIAHFFDGLDLVDPGIVWSPQWHPEQACDADADGAWCCVLAGLARKS